MLLVGTVVLCLTGCGKETQTANFSGVTSVCELATLKCYYHNKLLKHYYYNGFAVIIDIEIVI